jgi:Flp pilus assembly protein TadD
MLSNSGKIVYISLPDSIRCELAKNRTENEAENRTHAHHHEDQHDNEFLIDPSIPVPVLLEGDGQSFDSSQISHETILSAMIRVVTEAEPSLDPKRVDYYRRFVRAARPGIFQEFAGAAIAKAKNTDFAAATEICACLFALFPDDGPHAAWVEALVYEEETDLLSGNGRDKEADAAAALAALSYEKAIGTEGAPSGALFDGGRFFWKRQNFKRARACFEDYIAAVEGVEGKDDDSDSGLTESKKKGKAARYLKHIHEKALDDRHYEEAYTALREGRENDAMENVREYLVRHSDVWNGWFVLGWALRRLGRWQEGAAAFRKALEFGAKNADCHNELAICLMEMGDQRGARRELAAALTLEGENIKIISNLAVLAQKSGNTAEAEGFFRTVLELDPKDPLARQYFS